MNDEGVGVAGWLLADMTLVLALLFLSLVPSGASGAASVPVIGALGCSEDGAVLRCAPEVAGAGPLEFEWKLSASGRSGDLTAADGALEAFFDGSGWARLVVSGANGTSSPSTYGFDAPSVSGSLPEADFSFDQLVLDAGDRSAAGLAAALGAADIRERVPKGNEDAASYEAAAAGTAAEWLAGKRRDCLRIALVETFSRAGGGANRVQAGVDLSREVNAAFFAWPAVRDAFHGSADDVREARAAAYYSSFGGGAGGPESRINLFFVRDRGCVPAP